jgi:DNA polymerase
MRHLHIDIETFSDVDIKEVGLYRYVQSPAFQVLLLAYAFDDEPTQIIDLASGEEIPFEVMRSLLSQDTLKLAYNASFEWYCLCKHLEVPMPQAWLPQWRCVMLHSMYCGYPGGLANVGTAMSISQDKQKLSTGNSLIKLFCTPTTPTSRNGQRTRTLPHHEPEKWMLFKDYCKRDVEAEREIENKLVNFPVPKPEQELWEIDQEINLGGVVVDLSLIEGAIYCDTAVREALTAEAVSLTGLDNPNSGKQIIEWLNTEVDDIVEDIQKGTVKDLIQATDNQKAVRVLEIRQELSKTSNKKYHTMDACVCSDGRIRGLLQFYGANRTGRWAGRLVQVQNLPRNYLHTLDQARQLVRAKNLDGVKLLYGNVSDTLSQLIRTAFIPSESNSLFIADFSAIEARVIAWLAGEQWRLDVFASHGKIYEASAAQMFGVPIESIGKGSDLRQKGKVAELALGYQGGPPALEQMGALNMGLTIDELPDIVARWRGANRRIVDLWYAVERAAINTVKTATQTGCRGILFNLEEDYPNRQRFLTVVLPSRRKLFYCNPILLTGNYGKEQLYYNGMNQTTKKWEQSSTYGGKLVENIVQAIARDCLAESLVKLHNYGFNVVMHIHDEVVIDAPKGTSIEHICSIMGEPIAWAPGLLLKADGFVTDYYKKD